MDTEFDVVVVGGGIAGLSAGLASARLGRKTIVLTGQMLGGHLLSIEKIEGYPGRPDGVAGYELCPTVQAQAADAGAEFAMSEASGIERQGDRWLVSASSGNYLGGAVILASGTSLRELDVPGEAMLRGKGVSHCASCDAPLLRDQHAVVVGGGDSALQEALRLAEDVAEVVIAHRGESPIAQAVFQARANANARIAFRPNSEIEEILGEAAVTGVRMKDTVNGTVSDLETAAVFVYIGLEPNTAFLNGVIELDESGRVPTDSRLSTSAAGILAAGTVRAGAAGRSVAAAGEGTLAAIAADGYLAGSA